MRAHGLVASSWQHAGVRVRYDAERFPVLPASGDGGPYLTNGRLYDVIEVSGNRKQNTYRIECDDGTPAIFDARGFTVVDDTLGPDWLTAIRDDGVWVGPAEFLRPGFWESYFDGEPSAIDIYNSRQHQDIWRELGDAEHTSAWDAFSARHSFRPGVRTREHPGIAEPANSLTLDLGPVFAQPGPRFAAAEEAINAEALRAFDDVFGATELLALDWQHPGYTFRPDLFALALNRDWRVPIFPNGDYSAFFASDFRAGTFGHPWERSLCIIGDELIEALGKPLSGWLPAPR